jgi:hypothetical protein
MTRLHALRAGAARTAATATIIRAAAGDNTVALVRLQLLYTRADRPVRHVTAYDARFRPVMLDGDAVAAIDFVVRDARPDIDWTRDHDLHLDTGMLRRSPGADDRGYIPEDDHSFGGADPVFLPQATEPRSAA